jgi:hypothetical protein
MADSAVAKFVFVDNTNDFSLESGSTVGDVADSATALKGEVRRVAAVRPERKIFWMSSSLLLAERLVVVIVRCGSGVGVNAEALCRRVRSATAASLMMNVEEFEYYFRFYGLCIVSLCGGLLGGVAAAVELAVHVYVSFNI